MARWVGGLGERMLPGLGRYAADVGGMWRIVRLRLTSCDSPARPRERLVKHGKAVGGGDDDDTVVRGVDAIHACQQLVQRLLRLRVVAQRETLAPRLAVASSRVKVRVKVGVKVRVKVRGEGGGGGSL